MELVEKKFKSKEPEKKRSLSNQVVELADFVRVNAPDEISVTEIMSRYGLDFGVEVTGMVDELIEMEAK